jgi:phage repressor protein C with HTH and peptisase S24 domain
MKTYGEVLRELLKGKKRTLTKIAQLASVSRDRLNDMLKSKDGSDISAGDAFARVAAYLDMTPDHLDTIIRRTLGLDPSLLETAKTYPFTVPNVNASRIDRHKAGLTIPVHTKVPAGTGVDYQFGIMSDRFLPGSLLPHPEWGPGAFLVTGDSMSPYLQPGDTLIVASRLQEVRTGDIVIVGFRDGTHTVKRLGEMTAATWELVPSNPNHQRAVVKRDTIEWFVPVMVRIEPMYLRREVPWE